MEDQLVTPETAKLAHEKGFNIKCQKFYIYNGLLHIFPTNSLLMKDEAFAPTQSLLQKWLREVHNLHIVITVNQFGYGFMFSVIDLIKCDCVIYLTGGVNEKFTFEEALETGLQEALKLI